MQQAIVPGADTSSFWGVNVATDTLKILGQTALAATTLTDIYTVPAATQTTISTGLVCNRGSTETTFRVSIALAGAADNNKQYLYYDVPIPANDTFAFTLGVSLGAGDIVRAYAGNTNITVNIFGVEIA